MANAAIDVRFFRFVHPEPNTGCWLWSGARFKAGYGSFGIAGRGTQYAHRVAWELARGPIPPGVEVCHRCDVRACVNVEHLFLGTHRDNVRDAKAKGRHAHGGRHGNAKLTDEQVREALNSTETQAELAARFGVTRQAISDIRRGSRWSHLSVDRPGRRWARPVKLSHELAQQIRATSGSNRALAAQFGVSHATIGLVRAGRIWKV